MEITIVLPIDHNYIRADIEFKEINIHEFDYYIRGTKLTPLKPLLNSKSDPLQYYDFYQAVEFDRNADPRIVKPTVEYIMIKRK